MDVIDYQILITFFPDFDKLSIRKKAKILGLPKHKVEVFIRTVVRTVKPLTNKDLIYTLQTVFRTKSIILDNYNIYNTLYSLKSYIVFFYLNSLNNSYLKEEESNKFILSLKCLNKKEKKEKIMKKEKKEKQIFDFWNSFGIIKHRKLTLKIERKITTRLKEHTEDELKGSISNYARILKDPECYWSYRWTLADFLDRGIDKFSDFETAKNNYTTTKKGAEINETITNKDYSDYGI